MLKGEATTVDVVVVGGGMAGVAASVSAAATGAKTLLLECDDILGGNVSKANVHTFCGLYEPLGNESPAKNRSNCAFQFPYANQGFPVWFSEGLQRVGGALAPEVHGRVCVMPIYPSKVADYAFSIVNQFENLAVVLQANIVGLKMGADSSKPAQVNVKINERLVAYSAKTIVDASGDAIATTLAGADVETPTSEELQNATLIFRVLGVNSESMRGYGRLKLSAAIARAAMTGELPKECESVLVRPGEKESEAYVSLNLPKPSGQSYNPLDPVFMESYSVNSQHCAEALVSFLSNHVSGWSKCRLLAFPRSVGVRESRHAIGHVVLSKSDILEGQQFDDAIARSSWPIELWSSHRGADFQYPEKMADIPLRALISRSHVNLGMAGRCMSGSHEALGALRVLGTAMATGQAIGAAAAIAVEKGKSLTDVTSTEVNKQIETLTETVFSSHEYN